MEIRSHADNDALSQAAARLFQVQLTANPGLVVGLPTGGTPLGFYRQVVERQLDLSHSTAFNLDEYVGLSPDHPQSYASYMRENLLRHLPVGAWHIPNGQAADLEAECQRYEAAISAAGGLDLVFLGIGHNGHIGFNEPGTPLDARTRVVRLTETTRAANARFFPSPAEVPTQAISMGIKTILSARQVVLLASGRGKAEALLAAVTGPVTPAVPASALQTHPNVVVLVDAAAARLLPVA